MIPGAVANRTYQTWGTYHITKIFSETLSNRTDPRLVSPDKVKRTFCFVRCLMEQENHLVFPDIQNFA